MDAKVAVKAVGIVADADTRQRALDSLQRYGSGQEREEQGEERGKRTKRERGRERRTGVGERAIRLSAMRVD